VAAEDALTERYEQALQSGLPPDIHGVIAGQFEEIRRDFEALRSQAGQDGSR